MQYSAELYLAVQNSLYVAFGPPHIGAFIEVSTPLAAIALAILVRKRRLAFQWTLIGLVAVLLAFPVLFFALTKTANTVGHLD